MRKQAQNIRIGNMVVGYGIVMHVRVMPSIPDVPRRLMFTMRTRAGNTIHVEFFANTLYTIDNNR